MTVPHGTPPGTRTLEFSWTTRTQWAWPAGDRKLIDVADTVADLDLALAALGPGRRDLALQAGGACGIWPKRLAREFRLVVTFEPDPENFRCLQANCDESNITARQAALGAVLGYCDMARDASEATNAGAWYTGGTYLDPEVDSIQVVPIDRLGLIALDLLCLDVEGAESATLIGGAQAIARYRPVIMLEHKPLPHAPDPRPAGRWLRAHGYRHAADIHRDQVWVPT